MEERTKRLLYRIETSNNGTDWRPFMAWNGLQKCRAEGAFGILSGLYNGTWYRLMDSNDDIIEISHHSQPTVGVIGSGKEAPRVRMEEDVVNLLHRIRTAIQTSGSYEDAVEKMAKLCAKENITL